MKDATARCFGALLAPQRLKLGRSLQESRGTQTPSATFPPHKPNEVSPEKDLLPPQAGKWGNPAANISTLGEIQLSQAKSVSLQWAYLLSWAPVPPSIAAGPGQGGCAAHRGPGPTTEGPGTGLQHHWPRPLEAECFSSCFSGRKAFPAELLSGVSVPGRQDSHELHPGSCPMPNSTWRLAWREGASQAQRQRLAPLPQGGH